MFKIFNYLKDIWASSTLRKKFFYTLVLLALYRLLVHIPLPFIDIVKFNDVISSSNNGQGDFFGFFAILMGGALQQFSIIAVGLIPYINSSIIMQLLTAVIPALEELQEQGEAGTMRIQQYTRWLTLPLAFLQSIGMIYFINHIIPGGVIDVSSKMIVLGNAFVLTVGTIMIVWLGELITEKGISNGISMIIFSSIVAGMTSKVFSQFTIAGSNVLSVVLFMGIIVFVLVAISILLIRTRKEIPIIYARQGKVEERSFLPIPLNPVGMVPIIFSIAFITFPYLLSQIIIKFGTANQFMKDTANWIEQNINIYTQNPSLLTILIYFILIVLFTFFYTMIVFNPEKMSDNIQKRGGYISGSVRPGDETAKYLNKIIMHLCLWGGIGLGFIGIYGYILTYIPFIQQASLTLGSIPVIISGSGVIIVVGVVQDLINKLNSELLMERYDRI